MEEQASARRHVSTASWSRTSSPAEPTDGCSPRQHLHGDQGTGPEPLSKAALNLQPEEAVQSYVYVALPPRFWGHLSHSDRQWMCTDSQATMASAGLTRAVSSVPVTSRFSEPKAARIPSFLHEVVTSSRYKLKKKNNL